jgi:hypothetical protein
MASKSTYQAQHCLYTVTNITIIKYNIRYTFECQETTSRWCVGHQVDNSGATGEGKRVKTLTIGREVEAKGKGKC